VGKPARVSDFDEVCLHLATDGRVLQAHCSLHDGFNGREQEPQVALMKDVCDLGCSKGVVPRQLVAIEAEESALQKRSSNLLTDSFRSTSPLLMQYSVLVSNLQKDIVQSCAPGPSLKTSSKNGNFHDHVDLSLQLVFELKVEVFGGPKLNQ
jgi:hypothetical protein